MEPATMLSAGAALKTPQDIPLAPSTPVHPINWPASSCFSPARPATSTYQGSVLATSLHPGAEMWASTHHPWKGQGVEDQSAHAHDDSGISPGRTSSSGPSSVGGSPPAAKTAEPGSSMFPVKEEQPDEKDQVMSNNEDSNSISSEDNGDSSQPENSSALLRCPLCGRHDFDTIVALLNHCKKHPESGEEASTLSCSMCSLVSSSKDSYMAHLMSHIPQEHICSVCGFASRSSARLTAHLAEMHGMDPSDNNNDLSPSRMPGSNGKVKSFRCKQCSFVTHTKLEFWGHSRAHIKGDKMLACPRCPFVTEYKHHLEYHLRNHSGSKPFKCPQCPYTCVNKSMLNSHLKSHSNVYQYRCADCNYVTKYCHSLKLHLRKYSHNPAMVLNPDGSPNPLPIIDVYGTRRGPKLKKDSPETPTALVPVTFKCPQCDFQTMSEPHYQQHLITSHSNHPPAQAPVNPMKEYLTWVYAQQLGFMHQFNAHNALDLRKENTVASPAQSPVSPVQASKNRRKGKAPYKLEHAFVQPSEEREESQFNEREEACSSSLPPSERKEGKMYNCSYCDIFFKDAVMYAMHMGYHGYKDPFHCNMCGEKSDDRLSFFLHIARSSHL